MCLYSNYNELAVSNDEKYNVGDVFYYYGLNDKFKRFNGLKIISFCYLWDHKVLFFNWNDWENNKQV